MPFLVFRHIDPHHAVLVVEQEFCQGFCQFGLSYTGRPQEDEGSDRTFCVLQPGTAPADCIGDRPDGFILALRHACGVRPQGSAVFVSHSAASCLRECRSSARPLRQFPLHPPPRSPLRNPFAARSVFPSARSIIFSISGIRPYRISATLPRSLLRSAPSASNFRFSISFLRDWICSTRSFSDCHFAFNPFRSSVRFPISSFRDFSFPWSFSRLMASRSISSWRILRSIISSSSGFELISRRSFDAASSIRSIALSGRKRSEIYRCESSTAAMMASSLILTW